MRITESPLRKKLRKIIRESFDSSVMGDAEVSPESIENFAGMEFELSGKITGKMPLDAEGKTWLVYITDGKHVQYYFQLETNERWYFHKDWFERSSKQRADFWHKLARMLNGKRYYEDKY